MFLSDLYRVLPRPYRPGRGLLWVRMRRVPAAHPDLLDLESGLALIAVVGRGMRDTRGVASKVFDALAKANINIKMIDQGSSELNIIIGVKEKYFEDAIKVIYDAFITGAN